MTTLFRYFHVTDAHFDPLDRRPQSRSETYHEDCRGEWVAFCDIVRAESPDAVLFSGDLFNIKNQKAYSPPDLAYYRALLEECPARIYSIAGNHDLPKSSYALVEQTAYLNVVRSAENVTDLSFRVVTDRSFVVGNQLMDVRIGGIGYLPLEDFMSKLPLLCQDFRGGGRPSINLALLHPDALPRNDLPLHFQTCSWDQILDAAPNVHVACLGHIHQSFPVYSRSGPGGPQMVSKPWSLGRIVKDYFASTDSLEHQHRPMFADIHMQLVDGAPSLTIEYRPIPCVPFSRAFDRDTLRREVERAGAVSSFLDALRRDHGTVGDAFRVIDPEKYLSGLDISPVIREIIDRHLNA